MSTKKMQKDYEDVKKYKKMKEKNHGLNVEKILEKKRKIHDEARSTILPSIT